jgi:ABC-type amino acid transport substrate-binding protein
MLKRLVLIFIISFSAHAQKTYQIALASPAPWLGISNILYSEIAKNIPNVKFEVTKAPTKRVLTDLLKKKIDGEVGWVKDNIESFDIIATDTPIVELNFVLVTNMSKKFKNLNWKTINGQVIAYPRGAHYINHLLPLNSRYEVNRLEQAISLLEANRVDGVVTTMQYLKNKIKNKNIKPIKSFIYKVKLYPIFHKSNKKLRDLVNKSLLKMRKTGVYDDIRVKTGFNLLEKDLSN